MAALSYLAPLECEVFCGRDRTAAYAVELAAAVVDKRSTSQNYRKRLFRGNQSRHDERGTRVDL